MVAAATAGVEDDLVGDLTCRSRGESFYARCFPIVGSRAAAGSRIWHEHDAVSKTITGSLSELLGDQNVWRQNDSEPGGINCGNGIKIGIQTADRSEIQRLMDRNEKRIVHRGGGIGDRVVLDFDYNVPSINEADIASDRGIINREVDTDQCPPGGER